MNTTCCYSNDTDEEEPDDTNAKEKEEKKKSNAEGSLNKRNNKVCTKSTDDKSKLLPVELEVAAPSIGGIYISNYYINLFSKYFEFFLKHFEIFFNTTLLSI